MKTVSLEIDVADQVVRYFLRQNVRYFVEYEVPLMGDSNLVKISTSDEDVFVVTNIINKVREKINGTRPTTV